ncbi:MAG: formylglycine-generating enzyme family protein, partial [Alphaproteobacteria bacterium]|nr:formylglycine-generating enzyme family protein [Alphaproteobacteria bacterium]
MLGDDADLTLAEATAKHQLRQFAAAAADYRAGLARADGGSSLRQLAVGNYERAQRDQEIQLYGFAFRDCAECPIMVRIPAGQFTMGSPAGEQGRESVESPQRVVNIRSFALGKTEVTFAEWDACVNAGGCSHRPHDQGWGRGTRPVMNVSWDDAKQYATWLSRRTGKQYRLPSEAEWEYAARA